jgi:hypothetical protein
VLSQSVWTAYCLAFTTLAVVSVKNAHALHAHTQYTDYCGKILYIWTSWMIILHLSRSFHTYSLRCRISVAILFRYRFIFNLKLQYIFEYKASSIWRRFRKFLPEVNSINMDIGLSCVSPLHQLCYQLKTSPVK